MIARPLRRSLVAASIAACTVTTARAQSSDDETPLPPVAGFTITGGGVGFQSGALNTALAGQGRGQLAKRQYTLGVESWVRWDRVMLIAASNTYQPRRAPATNFTTESSGSHGSLDIGIPVILARKTLVYPMVGFGLSSSNVVLRRNGQVDFATNFLNIPSNGGRNVDLTARRYQAHIGVGADQVFRPAWPNLLMSIGLRAGYVAPVGDARWRSGPEKVVGAPELGLEGGYVRLTLGGVLGKRRYAAVPMIGSLLPFISR